MIATAETIDPGATLKSVLHKSPSQHLWIQEEEPDELAKAKHNFNFWLLGISENEALFEQYVYKNPNLSELDLHQHRSRLFWMLANGENLIVKFYKLKTTQKFDPSNYFKLIQENLDALLTTFNAWHGPLDAQEDVPQSFKDAVQELNRDELEPMDDMLIEQEA